MGKAKDVPRLTLRPCEAAQALGISLRTLWSYTAPRGPIPCLRLGNPRRPTVLYLVSELEAFLKTVQARQLQGQEGCTNG
jgi:hypothetical protein